MNIPLINSNSKQDINTSLIAIRNAINELARVKESASVEDLQRQINIINQQIANFNSEFSAINTHLNTIDTNILNLQPVDTVASGNMHSVTSNAVANSLDEKVNTAFYTDVDLNTIKNFGVYRVNYNQVGWELLHYPKASWGTLIVTNSNGEWKSQTFIPDSLPNIFQRLVYSNNNWSSWGEYAPTPSITEIQVTKTNNVRTVYNVHCLKFGKIVYFTFDMELASTMSGADLYNGLPRPVTDVKIACADFNTKESCRCGISVEGTLVTNTNFSVAGKNIGGSCVYFTND